MTPIQKLAYIIIATVGFPVYLGILLYYFIVDKSVLEEIPSEFTNDEPTQFHYDFTGELYL
jgi:uncharacterized membrane protein SpoIIM required for sporulation